VDPYNTFKAEILQKPSETFVPPSTGSGMLTRGVIKLHNSVHPHVGHNVCTGHTQVSSHTIQTKPATIQCSCVQHPQKSAKRPYIQLNKDVNATMVQWFQHELKDSLQ
jgi:hypothetical protein